MRLHKKLEKALRPFVGKQNCEENRQKIIRIVLEFLPDISTLDAEIAAIGILTGKGVYEAKEIEKEEQE